MAVSDLRINSAVRAIFARHWVDLQRIRYGSFRGTVRVSGELHYVGTQSGHRSPGSQLETLENEVGAVKGVNRVYFDLQNWSRNARGEWEPLDDRSATEASETVEPVDSKEASRRVFPVEYLAKKPGDS